MGQPGQGGAAGRLRLWPACGGAGAARGGASPGGSGRRGGVVRAGLQGSKDKRIATTNAGCSHRGKEQRHQSVEVSKMSRNGARNASKILFYIIIIFFNIIIKIFIL